MPAVVAAQELGWGLRRDACIHLKCSRPSCRSWIRPPAEARAGHLPYFRSIAAGSLYIALEIKVFISQECATRDGPRPRPASAGGADTEPESPPGTEFAGECYQGWASASADTEPESPPASVPGAFLHFAGPQQSRGERIDYQTSKAHCGCACMMIRRSIGSLLCETKSFV